MKRIKLYGEDDSAVLFKPEKTFYFLNPQAYNESVILIRHICAENPRNKQKLSEGAFYVSEQP